MYTLSAYISENLKNDIRFVSWDHYQIGSDQCLSSDVLVQKSMHWTCEKTASDGSPNKWCQRAPQRSLEFSCRLGLVLNKPRADYQIYPSSQPRAKHTPEKSIVYYFHDGKRNRNLRFFFFELSFWSAPQTRTRISLCKQRKSTELFEAPMKLFIIPTSEAPSPLHRNSC